MVQIWSTKWKVQWKLSMWAKSADADVVIYGLAPVRYTPSDDEVNEGFFWFSRRYLDQQAVCVGGGGKVAIKRGFGPDGTNQGKTWSAWKLSFE